MVEREDEGFMNIFEKWFPNGLLIGERPEHIDTIRPEIEEYWDDVPKYNDYKKYPLKASISKEEATKIIVTQLLTPPPPSWTKDTTIAWATRMVLEQLDKLEDYGEVNWYKEPTPDTITDEEYMQRFEEDRYKYGDKPVFMSKEEKFCILMGTLCVISWVIMVVSWLTS